MVWTNHWKYITNGFPKRETLWFRTMMVLPCFCSTSGNEQQDGVLKWTKKRRCGNKFHQNKTIQKTWDLRLRANLSTVQCTPFWCKHISPETFPPELLRVKMRCGDEVENKFHWNKAFQPESSRSQPSKGWNPGTLCTVQHHCLTLLNIKTVLCKSSVKTLLWLTFNFQSHVKQHSSEMKHCLQGVPKTSAIY